VTSYLGGGAGVSALGFVCPLGQYRNLFMKILHVPSGREASAYIIGQIFFLLSSAYVEELQIYPIGKEQVTPLSSVLVIADSLDRVWNVVCS
jgi:hypothetical protein